MASVSTDCKPSSDTFDTYVSDGNSAKADSEVQLRRKVIKLDQQFERIFYQLQVREIEPVALTKMLTEFEVSCCKTLNTPSDVSALQLVQAMLIATVVEAAPADASETSAGNEPSVVRLG